MCADRRTKTVNRQEAIACGAKHYDGKVCSKHPKFKGQRQTGNCNCVGCDKERKQTDKYRARKRARRQTDEYRAKNNARNRAQYKPRPITPRQAAIAKGEKQYTDMNKICPKHPELGGLRGVKQGCVKCHREAVKKRWKENPILQAQHVAWRKSPHVPVIFVVFVG